jgi:hypothetical protein
VTSAAPGRGRGIRGTATLMVAAAVAFGAMAGLGLVEASVVVIDAARAATAADAVALAAVDGGRDRAVLVADRSGAQIERLEIAGATATATVRVGRATAQARASAEP